MKSSSAWTKTLQQIAVFSGAALAISFAVVLIGFEVGREAGTASVERLSVVWPHVLSLPKDDRIALAKSAETCKLHRLPMPVDSSQVITCVRQGAAAGGHSKETIEKLVASASSR